MKLTQKTLVLALCLCLSTACSTVSGSAHSKEYFVAYPYLQLGYRADARHLTVCWLAEESNSDELSFQYKSGADGSWSRSLKIESNSVNGRADLRLYSVELNASAGKGSLQYRIQKDGQIIFSASTSMLPEAGADVDFAVFGDVGQGTRGESRVAALLAEKKTPLSIITGDIVYPIGSIHHYLHNFFPYLNDDREEKGKPIMRSSITVAAPGNHDITYGSGIDARNLDFSPDSLSYFVLWKQPLNGPVSDDGTNALVPYGSRHRIGDFLKAAGAAFPRMANFSFDYGNCHFLILDANIYMDWSDRKWREWVEADLKNTRADWKFVAFHQPGFNSDIAHREEQRMRLLSDIFERTGVNVVFSGHSHSYQRSYPLRFKADASQSGSQELRGQLSLDEKFDGDKNKRASGVIYIVSGAGGAALTHEELESNPSLWLPFTRKFACKKHSVSFCHAGKKHFSFKQIADDGSILDQFVLSKN